MTAPALYLRRGADPRPLAAFAALRAELAKLDHPARPDVNWLAVEGHALGLLYGNGAELHSLAALVLARAHAYGPQAASEALALLSAVLRQEWAQLWPVPSELRLALLNGLCERLQPWLRGLRRGAAQPPGLAALAAQLRHVQQVLEAFAHPVPTALPALQQALAAHTAFAPVGLAMPTPAAPWPPLPAASAPLTVLLAPPLQRARRRWVALGSAAGLALAAAAALSYAWPPAATVLPTPLRLPSITAFKPASANLGNEAAPLLAHLLGELKARPGWRVVLEGHSDGSGSPQRNQLLSQQRANAVATWLANQGNIDPACIGTHGHGSRQPLASNGEGQGRAVNRRVDVRLEPGCDGGG